MGQVERTPAGGLRVPATVAREGVLVYPWGREYVPRSTIEASAKQLNGLPVTLKHPRDRRVDSRNWQREAVGHAGDDARVEGDAQGVTVYVQRADAVSLVEQRITDQLSMGYDVTLDKTPGVTADGERYDAIQTARDYNHIALVEHARGGSTLALRLDEAGDAVIESPETTGEETTDMKKKIRIDGVEHEVEAPEAFFQAFDLSQQRADEALKSATTRADAAEGERDGLKKKLDEETKRADAAESPERLDERVKARAELESSARKVLGDKTDFAGKTDREIKEMVIRTDEKEDFSEKTDDYVNGAFASMIRTAAKEPREDGLSRVRRAIAPPKATGQDNKPSRLQESISRLRRDQAEAASRPLGGGDR